MPQLLELPVEVIQHLGLMLLENPSEGKFGSGICSLIRTSSCLATLLTPILLNAALRSTVKSTVLQGAEGVIMVSYPPEALWKSLSMWKSAFVLDYLQSLPLEYIDRVVFCRPRYSILRRWKFMSLLQRSIQLKNEDLIQCLIAHGADIHGPNLDLSPLREAIEVKNTGLCRNLLEAGAGKVQRRSYCDPVEETLLKDLITLDEELANLLIDNLISFGVDLDQPDANGCTSLFYAVRAGRYVIVLRLLSCGAAVLGPLQGLPTGSGCSVLAVAVGLGLAEISSVLLDYIETVGREEFVADANYENSSIAHKALKQKLWSVLERLIKLGIPPDCEDSNGTTLLEHTAEAAFSKGDRAHCESVLQSMEHRIPEAFARPEEFGLRGSFAAYINDNKMTNILKQKEQSDKELNAFDYTHFFNNAFPTGNFIIQTLTHAFSYTSVAEDYPRRGQVVRLLELLIAEGVPLIDSRTHETALHVALRDYRIKGFSEAVELLLDHATPEVFGLVNKEGDTILTLAIGWRYEPRLPEFLAKMSREDILLRDGRGNTPLTYLAKRRYLLFSDGSYVSTINTLLKACPELLHTRDSDGNTALHYFAHFSRKLEVVKFLHEAGAGLSELNNRGEPPFHGSHGQHGITTEEREAHRMSRERYMPPDHQNQFLWDPAVSRFFFESGADLHRGCKVCEKEVVLLLQEDETKRKGDKSWSISRHEPRWSGVYMG